MRRIVFGLLVLTLISGGYLAWSQRSSDSSPEAARDVYTYVALGDSYTKGTGVKVTKRWPNQLVERLRQDGMDLRLVANPGSAGFTTDDVMRTQLDELERFQPDLITVLIGMNDLIQEKPADTFRNDYQELLDTIRQRAPRSKVLALTLPNYALTPFGRRTVDTRTMTHKIHEYNAIIRQVSAGSGVRIVDVYPTSLLVTEDDSLVAYDGLHPSGGQYGMWVELVAPAVMVLLQD